MAGQQTHTKLKERAKEELRAFLILTLYLWVFLGSFTIYRRLLMAETGAIPYLHYGMSLIEALIIAKVILIADLFKFTRRFQDRQLIVPVLYKSVLFFLLILVFGVLEHLVEGWVRGEGALGGLRAIKAIGVDELEARVLVLIVALIPLFAFTEIARVLGPGSLSRMFFSRPER